MSLKKERVDKLLVERNLADSRTKAKELILAGKVLVNEKITDKLGTYVTLNSSIRVKEKKFPYVSRGGVKLFFALNEFDIDVNGLTAIDIGASTGGFTDCLLKNKAKKVYAIDVGYNQLAWSLRQDSRVVNLEHFNARYLKPEDIKEEVDIIVIDVSFISLDKIIPPALRCLKSPGKLLALIKPQFEVGKGEVGKGGIVKDPLQHYAVKEKIRKLCENNGLDVIGTLESTLSGPKGNKEFFIYSRK
ncbi:MAG: TlyA family RNA methyltransferase [Thermodesulfobacteriota bacterium]|nr:TlyA family RNA methyltransferase [Thermodesulfobacteriota bacterium]